MDNNNANIIDVDPTASDDEVQLDAVVGGDNRDDQNNETTMEEEAGTPVVAAPGGTDQRPLSPKRPLMEKPLVERITEVEKFNILQNKARRARRMLKQTIYKKNFRMKLGCDLVTIIEI